MKVALNIPYFLGSIVAFVLAYMTMTETIDKYIHFEGELNALAFCATALFMGIICLLFSFDRIEPVK